VKVRTLSGTRAVPSQKCDGWRNGMAGKSPRAVPSQKCDGWSNGMAGKMAWGNGVAGGAFIIGGKGPSHIRSLRTS
jgi:hypothetical protein